jgi:D-arabinose 1-dehydrogenase-like Zn-dependent alcohol dehydrogenase
MHKKAQKFKIVNYTYEKRYINFHMKAAVLQSPQKLGVREVEEPKAISDGVLISVKACGVCTADRRWYSGASEISYPAILGHEVSGVVEDVAGKKDEDLRIGDTVVAGGFFCI